MLFFGVFILIWWIVLFAVLPFKNELPAKIGKGHSRSAPKNPRLAMKLLIASITAFILSFLATELLERFLL